MSESADIASVRKERDLYLRLLNLGRQKEPEPFLKEALALIVEVIDARQGYLELHDDEDRTDGPRWWIAHGFSAEEISGVRARISRGIVAEAIATGQTIVTPSALLDSRFSDRESVRLRKIEAVLCAPIGEDPPRGVLYLESRAAPGLFSEADRVRAEIFAHHLATLADRLLAQQRGQESADPTRPLREKLSLEGVIGRSTALAAVLKQVALVVPLNVNVLLTGESGTGKSQLARAIHANGPRAGRPFVEVNCAALPANLIESEIFGHEKGAFTGATERRTGRFELAHGGTIFLDEIGEVPPEVQVKLLHVLQEHEFERVGNSQKIHADVRVIAATNTDLRRAMAEGRFREDLFYRLEVLPIRVPSLAERREDIPELAAFFCASGCERHALPRLQLSRNAIRGIEAAAWPGNIRQLAHAVEAAAIRAAGEGAPQVERAHVFPEAPPAPADAEESFTFQEATRRFQERLLRQTLEDTEWSVVEAARRLDLARSHVYNLIRAFGLERERG